jgi:hypothetical protein
VPWSKVGYENGHFILLYIERNFENAVRERCRNFFSLAKELYYITLERIYT